MFLTFNSVKSSGETNVGAVVSLDTPKKNVFAKKLTYIKDKMEQIRCI